jgi:hypothetical protein
MFNAKANVKSPRLMPMQSSITCASDDVAGEQPLVFSSPTLMTGIPLFDCFARLLLTTNLSILGLLLFLPWQKVFLPGQWKKLVKTGKNRQKLENAVYVTGIRSLTLPGSSKRLNLLNLNLQL